MIDRNESREVICRNEMKEVAGIFNALMGICRAHVLYSDNEKILIRCTGNYIDGTILVWINSDFSLGLDNNVRFIINRDSREDRKEYMKVVLGVYKVIYALTQLGDGYMRREYGY